MITGNYGLNKTTLILVVAFLLSVSIYLAASKLCYVSVKGYKEIITF